jgi:ATP-dependent helicase YprA (DUF1998 family)
MTTFTVPGLSIPADVGVLFDEERRLDTSISTLDAFIGGFRPSQVTLIDSAHPMMHDILHLLCAGMVRGGQDVVWVDGGHSVNPYQLSGICRRFRMNVTNTLQQVNVSRAFTAYQLSTLIEEMAEDEVRRTGAGLLIVSSFLDLFQDKDMAWRESMQLMKASLAKVREMTASHSLVTVVTNMGLSKMLYKRNLKDLMYGSADRVLRIENARRAIRMELVNEGRSMLYHPVPYYQTTLEEFWR